MKVWIVFENYGDYESKYTIIFSICSSPEIAENIKDEAVVINGVANDKIPTYPRGEGIKIKEIELDKNIDLDLWGDE